MTTEKDDMTFASLMPERDVIRMPVLIWCPVEGAFEKDFYSIAL